MVWAIGGAVLYFVLIVTLGVMTLRKGHWIIFIIGIFLPFFWLFGAMTVFAAAGRLLGEPAISLLRWQRSSPSDAAAAAHTAKIVSSRAFSR